MDRITSITKVAIIAVTFPAVHKLTHDLEIADLVVATAVDPVERAKHFLVVFVSVKVGAPLSRRDPPALAVRQPSKARSDFQEYEAPCSLPFAELVGHLIWPPSPSPSSPYTRWIFGGR